MYGERRKAITMKTVKYSKERKTWNNETDGEEEEENEGQGKKKNGASMQWL